MADFLTFTILGVALGAIYAIAASGLVLTYTTSGIFNFAHGAFAMFSAYLYWQFKWYWGWPAPFVFILVLGVICPITGILLERFVARGLQNTTESTKIVVPIALLLLLTGSATWIWPTTIPRIMRPFFGSDKKVRFDLGDQEVFITYHQIIVLALALVIAVGLYLFLAKTPLGIKMRAVVDSRELVRLTGGRPNRIASYSWILGISLAGLSGILIASLQNRSLDTFILTLVVINAFAAAIFGRLKSLPITFVGSFLVGLAVNYWNWISDTGSKWEWLTGLRVSLPVVLLFVVLLLLPHERLRGAIVERTKERFSTPSTKKAVLWSGIMIIAFLGFVNIAETKPIIDMGNGVILGIIALSLVLLTGYAGELNLAPLTFAGLGAIIIFQFEVGAGNSPLKESTSIGGLIMVMAICGAIGALIALPALRLRGLYLGIATFAFAVFISNMVFQQRGPLYLNIPFFGDGEDFRIDLFSNGSINVPRPNWFGLDFRSHQAGYLILVVAIFAILGIGLVALRHTAYGRQLTAMKDSPAACATLGLNLTRLKVSVFAMSSAIAGLGGALLASHRRAVSQDDFDVFASLPLVLLAVVAGVGYVSGAFTGGIMAGVLFVVLGNIFDKLAEDYSTFDWLFSGIIGNFFIFVGAAGAAVSLARAPGGFLNDTFEGYREIWQRKNRPAVAFWVLAMLVLYLLTFLDVINNWTFGLTFVFSLGALPLLGAKIMQKINERGLASVSA